jgi:hypothetical protein
MYMLAFGIPTEIAAERVGFGVLDARKEEDYNGENG